MWKILGPLPKPSGNWYRASGGCICEVCGRKYYDHPYNFWVMCGLYGTHSMDHVLCNGDEVHL